MELAKAVVIWTQIERKRIEAKSFEIVFSKTTKRAAKLLDLPRRQVIFLYF